MELVLLNGYKSKKKLKRLDMVKITTNLKKKHYLRGQRNVSCYERILSGKKKSYNFTT